MIDGAYYLFNAFGISTKPDRLMLLKWVNVSEKRFNEVLNTVSEAKNNGLKINVDGREITLDKAQSLLKDVGSGKIDWHEFKEKYNNIFDDVKKILNRSMLTRIGENMVKILSMLREISKPKEEKTDKQPYTTNMPELESEESAAQRRNQQGQGLKILTPNQMLSRLPISLAQLKAGNNSENFKSEIRQPLYSLYRSKKLTKSIYFLNMETIFMNTENSKTSESNKLFTSLLTNLILNLQITKILDWLI